MDRGKQNLAVCSLMALFVTACTSEESFKQRVGRALNEDPSILSNSIEKNPEAYVLALQSVVAHANMQARKEREERREQEIAHYLKRPLNPRRLVNDVYRGNANAPLTIVQYIDFECAYCARGQKIMERIESRYPKKVRFLVRHMPSSSNLNAIKGAVYFEALKRQGKELAFDWHDNVFSRTQDRRSEDFYRREARLVGADMGRLAKDVSDRAIYEKVNGDIQEASRFGFKGTPGYIVGGVPVRGAYPEETFIRLIEEWGRQARLGIR